MGLTKKRLEYRPFEYEFAYDYYLKQQQSHWLKNEIEVTKDLACWHNKMSDHERTVVTRILRLFTQTECLVGEYWSSNVARWFPKPEIQLMASAFSAMEGIHADAYSYLNDSLDIPESEYKAFTREPSMMAKLNKMEQHLAVESGDVREIARSLAVFSAFVEGVSLFSSFAVLLNFQRSGKLLAIGDLIAFSIRDETLHSNAGCHLFRTLVSENITIWTDDFKKEIYQAARDMIALEDSFLEYVFDGIPEGAIEGVDLKSLKKYIRYRANVKLGDLGLKRNWSEPADGLAEAEADNAAYTWIDVVASGTNHSDFFSRRVTDYAKGHAEVGSDDLF